MKKFDLTSEVRGALRLIFRKSPHRKAALTQARCELPKLKKDGTPAKKPAVWYCCSICQQLFKPENLEIHHLEKVGPAPGSKHAPKDLTWETFIHRMFCDHSKLAVLCKPCHRKITKEGK